MVTDISVPQNTQTGTLQDTPLPELLQALHREARTGVLLINYPNERLNSAFSFSEGRIGRVLTPFAPKLSDFLISLGASSERLRELQVYLKADRRTREVMLAEGRVKPKFLTLALEARVEMALLPIFHNTTGVYEFQEGEQPIGFIEPGADPQKLSDDIAQRLDALADLGAFTLSPYDAFRVVGDVGDFSKRTSDFTILEWRILAALFKPRTLLQLSTELVLNWDSLLRVLLLLERRGIVEQVDIDSDSGEEYSFDDTTPLTADDSAPNFLLPSLEGTAFSLVTRRGKTCLLSFLGHAGSVFANHRVNQLVQQYDRLHDANIEVVCIFSSMTSVVQEHVGQLEPPFLLLADAEHKAHNLYRTSSSVLGLLDPRNLSGYLAGMRLGTAGGDLEGERSRMPATFLVSPALRVAHAHYGRYANDTPSAADVVKWASTLNY
ncbi:MAG: DUF4388 domain-containing protein [Deinococcota bacterium]